MLKGVKEIRKLWRNLKGAATPATIIMLVIGFFVLAILAPIALDYVANASAANWDPTVVLVFKTLLPIIFVIGVAIKYVPRGR